MSGLCHGNIAFVIGRIITPMGLFIVFPFYRGGDLYVVFNHIPQISLYTQESRISYVLLTIITLEHRYTMLERQPAGRFVPETVQNVGSQIMAGVSFMHEKGVVHRLSLIHISEPTRPY